MKDPNYEIENPPKQNETRATHRPAFIGDSSLIPKEMKKNISLENKDVIIKGLTLVSIALIALLIALLVFIGFNNNKNKTYNSNNKNIEIYIAPSDEYSFEEMLYNFDYFNSDYFKMDGPVNEVKVVVYKKNKVLEMYSKSQKLEVYYQNNFYYIIKIEK